MRALLRILASWALFVIALTIIMGGAPRIAPAMNYEWAPDFLLSKIEYAQAVEEQVSSTLSAMTEAPDEIFDWTLLAASLLTLIILLKFGFDFIRGASAR